jgi:methylenetetrahydrofolate dehydrogenase (NADP+) / methenyltetrahydrofolate cyclohydrolase
MRIDGNGISSGLYSALHPKCQDLRRKGTIPKLGIILVGDNPESQTYIRQKQKNASLLGIETDIQHLPGNSTLESLNGTIDRMNADPHTHGVILQRPLPDPLMSEMQEVRTIVPVKNVDGFGEESLYIVPVAAAVILILQHTFTLEHPDAPLSEQTEYLIALMKKRITVIGKGSTAGFPIAKKLQDHGANLTVIDSKTPQRDDLLRQSDVIISCVGKLNVVRRDTIKNGVILISVGISQDQNGKLHGDYEEGEIAEIASFYTPTPGGVGPVNVACLMANVLQAASGEIR